MNRSSFGRSGPAARHAGLGDWPRFLRRFLRLAGPYWRSERRWWASAWLALLTLLTAAQVGIPLAINFWTARFFDALENREFGRFAFLVGILVIIVLANVAIVTAHLRVKRRLQVDWRSWLTRHLVDGWMVSGRHYQLSYLDGEHDNPDGRIAEDARITTELAIDLGHSLFYCVLLLVSFTDVLWSLSGSPYIGFGNFTIFLPGHLVWVAIAYALTGTVAALLLGRPLVRTAEKRQSEEAEFRFGLAHARDNTATIAFARAEESERRRFRALFSFLVTAWDAQTQALANMYYYNSSWSVLTQVFPLFVAAPRYIAGAITLGMLMQTAQAFQHMVGALSWVIDHVSQLAEWRASAERVLGLSSAIEQYKDGGAASNAPRGIEVSTWPEPHLSVRNVTIAKPTGEAELSNCNLEIHQGERVLIMGDPSAGSLLSRAIAGIWPWGQGEIRLPEKAKMAFLSERPYMPDGSLRESVAFPSAPGSFSDADIQRALERVGLKHLVDRLDQVQTWEQHLSADDQQRLSFARLLLQRPDWIFLLGATDALDPAGVSEIMTLLRQELPAAALIVLGQPEHSKTYYHRHVIIERGQLSTMLREKTA